MGKRTSDPTGVVGCTEDCKATAMVCMLNHTIVEFRPHRTWRGEFGFDWLRVDDAPVLGHVLNEPPYKDCITGSYNSGNTLNIANAAAYNDLKTAYHKLSVNSHRAVPKNEYFIPWLNLYAENISDQINNDYKAKNGGADLPVKPPFEAELRLIINVQGDTKPKELEIVFPSEYFTIEYPTGAAASGSPVTIPATGACFAPNSPGINYDLPDTIKVKCIKEFSADQYIDVWAHHYQHTQAEIDQLEQENQQLNGTDIPALEQEKAALEAEAQTLQTQITTQEAQVNAQQATVSQLEAEIAALEAESADKTRNYLTIENLLQAHALLDDEAKKVTDVEDFQLLNQPGEREKRQAEINTLKAEVAKLEQQIAQKKTQLQAPQEQLENMQKELEAKKAELKEKQNQIQSKQQEIEQKRGQVTQNTEEMNKMQGRSLAGKLCMCANDDKHRKTVKMLWINVRVNLSVAIPLNPLNESVGSVGVVEKRSLYHSFYQALIYPNVIDNIVFDRTTDPKFKFGAFANAAGEFRVLHLSQSAIPMHLKEEFFKANRQYKESEYFTAFFFNVPGESSVFGEAELSGMFVERFRKNVAMYSPRRSTTFAHEGLHGFGLYHTHSDGGGSIEESRKYVYYGTGANYNKATTNIMSYKSGNGGSDRYDTWHWQWKIMRDNI